MSSLVTVTVMIEAPRDRVFAAATDLQRWPETMSQIKQLEVLTEGEVGTGTRFRETRVMYGREATEEMEITAFEPPSRYTVEANSHGVRYISTFHFVDHPSGGTQVTMTFDGQPQTLSAKLLGGLMKPMIKKAILRSVTQDLEELKDTIEREWAAAGATL
jgi:uncharacterized protein YndB with AHSA1/START domain